MRGSVRRQLLGFGGGTFGFGGSGYCAATALAAPTSRATSCAGVSVATAVRCSAAGCLVRR